MNTNIKTGNGPAIGALWSSIEGLPVSRWGNWRIWLNLGLLFITLGMAVYSIEQARWIYPQPYFTLTLLLSVVSIWVMMVYRLPVWLLHLVAVIIGILVIIWQGTMILPAGAGIGNLFSVIGSWWQGRGGLQGGNSKIIFGMFLVLVTWVTGYLSTWFVLRYRNAWPAILMGLLIILINLTNLPAIHFVFFILFIVASVLLLVQTNAVRQQTFSGNKANYSGKSLWRLTMPLTGIIILSVLISWVVPQLNFTGLENAVTAKLPWKNLVDKSSLNVFRDIPPKIEANSGGGPQDLTFGTSWNSGEDIIYTVVSPQPAYWQVSVYEKYVSQQWVNVINTEKPLKKNNVWDGSQNIAGLINVKYQVIPNMSTDIVLVAGQFVSAEMPVKVLYGTENDVIGVKSAKIINANEKYTVNSYLTDYSADTLSAAGTNYPESVKKLYLQLPESLPDRIRALSENLTISAKTPYEKIIDINTFLSQFPYSLSVAPVPDGADPIDDFLFTQKKGFCLHFASAMTVMLRSAGVPARLVTGYVPGDPGPEKGTYLLRDKHAHAWTQVYFPGYGWLDFDPTPGGPSNSPALTNTPLVSSSHLKEWDYWDLFGGIPFNSQGSSGTLPQPNKGPVSQELPFAKGLGILLFIALIGLALFIVGYGTIHIIKPFYSRRVWYIDRDNPASSAYANLCRLASMYGVNLNPWQTPLEVSSQIAEVIPGQSQNLQFLVRAYMDKRFGPDKEKPSLYEEAEILKTRILVNNAIIEKKGRLQRYMLRG